jgi:hypothetical protein
MGGIVSSFEVPKAKETDWLKDMVRPCACQLGRMNALVCMKDENVQCGAPENVGPVHAYPHHVELTLEETDYRLWTDSPECTLSGLLRQDAVLQARRRNRKMPNLQKRMG